MTKVTEVDDFGMHELHARGANQWPATSLLAQTVAMMGTHDALALGMSMPTVSRYMTAKPVTIERTATLAKAHEIMREHSIRHLPVIDASKNLCGVISQRDIDLLETLVDRETMLVEAAMVERPFIVTGDTALDEVVEIMGEHRYGSVVVMGRSGIEGIFTTTDACLAFTQILRASPELTRS